MNMLDGFEVNFSSVNNLSELKREFISNLNLKLNSENYNALKPILGKLKPNIKFRDQKLDSFSIFNLINAKNNGKKVLLNAFVVFTEQFFNFFMTSNRSKSALLNNNTLGIRDFIDIYQSIFNRTVEISYDLNEKKVSLKLFQKYKRQSALKSSGSYYTPEILTHFMISNSIKSLEYERINYFKENLKQIEEKIVCLIKQEKINIAIIYLKRIFSIKIIDLSIGMGVFLISSIPYLIETIKTLSTYLETLISDIQKIMIASERGSQEFNLFFNKFDEKFNTIHTKKPFIENLEKKYSIFLKEKYQLFQFINENCLYGLDIDENAVKLSKFFILIELTKNLGFYNFRIEINEELPNIKCKNSLISEFSLNINKEQESIIKKLNGIIWDDLYPEVFHKKSIDFIEGFDIIIGNPPWEILKPNDREFFNIYDDNFISLPRNKQEIKKKQLLKNKKINDEYNIYIKNIEEQLKFFSNSKIYNHQGAIIKGRRYSGDPQYYKLFLELAHKISIENGFISLIVQQNFLGSKGCSGLRNLYINQGNFEGIWEFYNKTKNFTFFDNIDYKQRFILFLYKNTGIVSESLKFKKCISIDSLNLSFSDYETIDLSLLKEFSKEELQIFTFSNDLSKKIFLKLSRFPTISNIRCEGVENLKITLTQDLHVTRDRKIILNSDYSDGRIAVIGGKYIAPYFTSKSGFTNYVDIENLDERLKNVFSKYSLICRNILPNSAKRMIFSFLESGFLVDNSCTRISLRVLLEDKEKINEKSILLYLLAIFNSFIVEFFIKTILTGINLNYYLIERIPIPNIDRNNKEIVKKIIENVKSLISQEPGSLIWIKIYEEVEILVSFLYKLTYEEFYAVLQSFNFEKLSKTNFSGIKIFNLIKKERIIEKYKKITQDYS